MKSEAYVCVLVTKWSQTLSTETKQKHNQPEHVWRKNGKQELKKLQTHTRMEKQETTTPEE